MALKSAWAHRNGGKIMKDVNTSLTSEKNGWIKRGDLLMYAERYNEKLMIKTYSNKTQCKNKVLKLKEMGYDCFISEKHPFTINIKNQQTNK